MREYSVDPLAMVRVSEVMDRNVPTVPAGMRLLELSDCIASHDPRFTRHEGLLIVDNNGDLAGIITRGDVLRALEENGGDKETTVLSAGSRDLVVAYPDEVLYDAAAKMLRNNIGRLPVVLRQNPRRVIGYLGRSAFMAGHLRRFEEEQIRERNIARRTAKRPVLVAR